MKLRTALITLALLAPVTHAETLSVEQILAMQNARNAAHAQQERSDNALIIALCARDQSKECLTSTRKLIVKYKAGVVMLHENDKAFTERMSQYSDPAGQ